MGYEYHLLFVVKVFFFATSYFFLRFTNIFFCFPFFFFDFVLSFYVNTSITYNPISVKKENNICKNGGVINKADGV